jgi:hypothetical protein
VYTYMHTYIHRMCIHTYIHNKKIVVNIFFAAIRKTYLQKKNRRAQVGVGGGYKESVLPEGEKNAP